jgi:coenzyme Q-binding protein COQ10
MPIYAERRISPYSIPQLTDLVLDVESYPQFLPWCTAAKVHTCQPKPDGALLMQAELVIRFKNFRESYVSDIIYSPASEEVPASIHVCQKQGPFAYLRNHWSFQPALEGGTLIDFTIEFEFRSKILGALLGMFFEKATQKMMQAFEIRAQELYSTKSQC